MSYDESDVRWNWWWTATFGAVTLASLLVLPFLHVRTWVTICGGAFTVLEGIGLRHHRDQLPPLTYITRRYVPRWATATLVGAMTGVACWAWGVFETPLLAIPLFALWGWLTEHFDVTYSA